MNRNDYESIIKTSGIANKKKLIYKNFECDRKFTIEDLLYFGINQYPF